MANSASGIAIGEATLLMITSFSACFFNIIIISLVYCNKQLRTSFNFFVLNMCLADILVSMNIIITVAISLAQGDFPTNTIGCTTTGFINILCFVASVVSLAGVSINRYYLIVHWQRYHAIFPFRRTFIFISSLWIFSAFLVTPPLLGWGRISFHQGKSICFVDWESSLSYMMFMISTCFCGPIMLTLISLFRILRVRRKISAVVDNYRLDNRARTRPIPDFSKNNLPTASSEANGFRESVNLAVFFRRFKRKEIHTPAKSRKKSRDERRLQEERYITLSILVVVLIFFIAWSPFVVVMLLQTFGRLNIPRWADFGALVLGCMNSTANPLVYLTMNGNFRRASVALCRRIFKIKKISEDSDVVG